MTRCRAGHNRAGFIKVKSAILLTSILALTSLLLINCIPPKSSKGVKNPHDGEPLNSRVAVVYSDNYTIRLGGLEKLHPHPQKYAPIYYRLISKGYIKPADVFVPTAATDDQIMLVHSDRFMHSLQDSREVAEFLEVPAIAPVPNVIVHSKILSVFESQVGGTILAGKLALKYGIAINIGGGYHHSKIDHGEGFCVYNDLAIALEVLFKDKLIKKAAVIDLDVHQGNGTAEIFEDDARVYTFSMHEGGIYPIPKSESDLDIELEAGTDDAEYLKILRPAIKKILDTQKPDIVMLQAGADVLSGDPLGNLELTFSGLVARDAIVIDECVKRNIPVVYTTGGGYAKNSWKAQFLSIERTIKKYGLVDGKTRHEARDLTIHEKMYTK